MMEQLLQHMEPLIDNIRIVHFIEKLEIELKHLTILNDSKDPEIQVELDVFDCVRKVFDHLLVKVPTTPYPSVIELIPDFNHKNCKNFCLHIVWKKDTKPVYMSFHNNAVIIYDKTSNEPDGIGFYTETNDDILNCVEHLKEFL